MATGISFNGIGSGIDFGAITDSIIAQRTRPVLQLQLRQADMRDRTDALKQLNAKLITLIDASRRLTDRALGTTRTATSSNADVAGVTATDAASPAAINLNVTRLASNFVATSRTFAATEPVLAGTDATATFVLRKGGATSAEDKTITISSTNNTLAGLRDAINAAGADTNASIVDVTGRGDLKLVLTSTKTGAANRVELTDANDSASHANLNLVSVNPPGAAPDFATLDASLSLNGLSVTRSSNTITDAVTGVTLNLKKTGEASVNIGAAVSDVADKLKSFVDAYNAVQDFVAKQYAADGNGKPGGVLAGDPTLREAQRQLRASIGADSPTNGGAFKNLTEIGLGRDEAGKLTLDRTVLDDKLKTSFGDVQALLSGKSASDKGLAHSILTSYEGLGNATTGMVQNAISGYTASIKSIDANILNQQTRIDALRASLSRQFAVADAAIGQLNGQNTALGNIIKSLQPRDN